MKDYLLKFIIHSRQNTYAAGIKPQLINNGKAYVIKDGELEYRDTYFDQEYYFQGQEIVFENNKPVWSASYRGAAIEGTDVSNVFAALQKFIKTDADKVRFGDNFEKTESDFKYICKGSGNPKEFNGREEIYQNNKLVHWMDYFGGEIK
jgi:hypothetical protein